MKYKRNKDLLYNANELELKWQEKWEIEGIFSPNISNSDRPFYNLMMFPYPSAEGLHVGNMYAFTGADVYARFNRMNGKDVFEPIGLDGFGIHSENYAIKVGRHPKDQAKLAEKNFYRQLRSIGNSFDWKRTVETYNPEYYKWTQWIFIQLFKKGLAYRKKASVNWCPKDLTVLSDEQVIDGRCERCDSEVIKKDLEQWFFKITSYADRLLNNIDSLKWSEKVKIAQKNWIGKSDGAEIKFKIDNSKFKNGTQKLKFSPELIEKILSGEKIKTYRLTQKDFVVGDRVSFIDANTGGEFAAAQIKKVELKKFGELSISEPGHEIYNSPQEMLSAYKKYYPEIEISKDSNVWIYLFELEVDSLKVFTTRPDTLYGVTFMVISPEHELSVQISQGKYKSAKVEEVRDYINKVKQKSEGAQVRGKEKTGVLTGLYAINPVNSKKIPILVSDYVLAGYGTGAIMAVPAHDQRDFETAKAFSFEIVPVIKGKDGKLEASNSESAYEGIGEIIGSDDWNGLQVPKDIPKVLDWLEKKKMGSRKSNFHLRDWLISRQRYWGPPIPMIYCENCAGKGDSYFTSSDFKSSIIHNSEFIIHNSMPGWYPVPDAQLPVKLPEVEDWKPIGTDKAPLANHPEFYSVSCPECGKSAIRETDVSDTFLDSSWYFLRYPSSDNSKEAFNPVVTKKWLPVDQYIGGAEHAVLHLLYSRFITMALYDMDLLDFEEPFANFYAHGLIIKDGAKMSKSKGNVVVPDDYIKKYGADSLRAYLMFLGPYSEGGDFRDSGIEGMNKFIRRVWKLVAGSIENSESSKLDKNLDFALNKTIKEVTDDISSLKYNTAIAHIMEYYNDLNNYKAKNKTINHLYVKTLLLLIAPFAPHMAEELWQLFKNPKSEIRNPKFSKDNSIHFQPWPQFDSSKIEVEEVVIVVQVNGKRRGEIVVKKEKLKIEGDIEDMAKVSVLKHIEGLSIKKTIYVPGKIVNFVI